MDILNCGLVALKKLTELKKVSMFSLIHLAKDNGINLYFCKVEPDELLMVKRPAIFHQKDHFVFIDNGSPIPEGEYTGYVLTEKAIHEPLPFTLAKKIKGEQPMPPQMPPQDPAALATGGQPAPAPEPGSLPQAAGGANVEKIMQVLTEVLKQCVDQQGFVDLAKVVQLWPQVAQQSGLNIPFQIVMQLIQQSPDVFAQLFQRLGLAGIIVNGRRMSAQEMLGMASGATSGKI